VLVAEDRDAMRFSEWHEAYLQIVANQIALGVDRLPDRAPANDDTQSAPSTSQVGRHEPDAASPEHAHPKTPPLTFRKDDAVFVDGIPDRNIPARILTAEESQHGRTEFTNREVRLDESLGLPPVKDNRKPADSPGHRLREKCPIRRSPTGRGDSPCTAALRSRWSSGDSGNSQSLASGRNRQCHVAARCPAPGRSSILAILPAIFRFFAACALHNGRHGGGSWFSE
jgi:hypothetical protein